MEEFDALRKATLCPFAKKAKVWQLPVWDPSGSFEANMAQHAASLREFARVCGPEFYHGCAGKVGMSDSSTDFDRVKSRFRQYLTALAQHDRDCARALSANYMSTEWQFEYAGVRMFLNVFAACYAQPHSKYIRIDGGFLVLFQPEGAFDLCGTNPINRKTKEDIRSRFARAGMPYNGNQIDQRFEALLYMFPEEPFAEPVRWWE